LDPGLARAHRQGTNDVVVNSAAGNQFFYRLVNP
jgi:hypothetical protein